MQQIENNEHLLRDPASNAVVNTNRSGFEAARSRKARLAHESSRMDRLEQKLTTLQSMFMEFMESNNANTKHS